MLLLKKKKSKFYGKMLEEEAGDSAGPRRKTAWLGSQQGSRQLSKPASRAVLAQKKANQLVI